MPRHFATAPIEDRLWQMVDVGSEDECWPWRRHIDKDGYGRIRDHGQDLRAHRVAWSLLHGPVPAGMMILHTCDNPPCCNPKHLFVGTAKNNIDDCVSKGRLVVHLGSSNGSSKLVEDDVVEIRRLSLEKPQIEIAAIYSISRAQVSRIINRQRWAHV